MHKSSFTRIAWGAVVAAVLVVAPGTSFAAIEIDYSDPFIGRTVNLQRNGGELVALPDVGPGGSTLYSREFVLRDFELTNFTGGVGYYKAEYYTEYYDVITGDPVAPFSTTLQSGTAAAPDSATFVVQYLDTVTDAPRSGPFSTGAYTMRLLEADFYGVSPLGDPIVTSLASSPEAEIEIANNPEGGYLLTYVSGFEITGEYTFKGNTHEITGLSDANNGLPAAVPEPGTALLLAPGLLGIRALRRYRESKE